MSANRVLVRKKEIKNKKKNNNNKNKFYYIRLITNQKNKFLNSLYSLANT
jgi:hypothetical protein